MAVTLLDTNDKQELQDQIDKIDNLRFVKENEVATLINPNWESDYAIKITTGEKVAYTGSLYAEIPVYVGEVYQVWSRPYYQYQCVACKDSNGNLIDGYLFPNANNTTYINERIVIPKNCTTLVVSSPTGDVNLHPFRLLKITETSQKTGLKVDYDCFDNELKPLINEMPIYENVEFTANKTGYYRATLGNATQDYLNSDSGYYNGTMPVKVGEKYKITTKCGANVAGYVFFDENGKWIDRYPNKSGLALAKYTFEITIPSGCVSLGVSGQIVPTVSKATSRTLELANNPLFSKKIALNGDSICANNKETSKSFGYQIAEKNNMKINNVAVGGGTIAYGTTGSDGSNRHWICNTVSAMDADADYVLFEGGINDYWNDVPLGSITDTMTAEVDNTTFYGALESICRQALVKWVGKKIGFVVTHKIQGTWRIANDNGSTFANYHQAIIDVCKKYSIPVCDLYETSNFNTELPEYLPYTTDDNNTGTGTGVHPTTEGYKLFYVDKITNFLKSL